MKISHRHINKGPSSCAAFSLLEALVYMGLFLVITALAYAAFWHGWENSQNLRRITEQIARTMTTGERWRADVRTATGPLRAETLPEEQILHIPHGGGETQYRFADGTISRRPDLRADWQQVLDRVKASNMHTDVRGEITAWRWEVELKTREPKKREPKARGEPKTRMPPVLTFLAVPGRPTPAR